MMKRWVLKHDVTNIDDLETEEVDVPEPGSGQVRVRVKAVSLNARDRMVIAGPFGRLPEQDIVPASDMAGAIDAVGTDVTAWAIGDSVVNLHFRGWRDGAPPADAGMGLGSLDEDGVLAEYVVLDATRVARAPASLSPAEAACLPCAGVTAWNAMFGEHPVTAEQHVLVTGSGGVSLFALQFAQAVGASVAAMSGSADKRRRLMELGAEPVIDRQATPDWGEAVLEATGGVHKVVDSVGPGAANRSLTALAYGGEVAVVGLIDMEGPAPGFALYGKSLRGIMVGSERMYDELSAFVDKHALKPIIGERFGFDAVREALHAQGAAEGLGKIVIEL